MKAFLSLIFTAFSLVQITAQTVNVQTYGATPNNNSNDDYTAITNAITACKSLANPILVLPEGTYHITSVSSGTPYFPIDGIDNLTIKGEGAGAKIEFTGFNYFRHVFKFTNCKNLTVQNLKIDYTEPPFTQGKIIQSGTGWMDIEVQVGFHNIEPANKPQIKAYALYDNVLEQQISGTNEAVGIGNGWYWENKANRIMRIQYNNNGYANGTYILLRHTLYDGYSFITSEGCENVAYKDITIYTAPGYPFTSEKGPENISFINCRIEKKPGFWMTSTVDGAHLLDGRGNITFDNCYFENMGDDAINLHGYFFFINTYLSSKKIRVNSLAGGWHDDAGFKVGDKCEFIKNSTNQSVGVATIQSIERVHYPGNVNQMNITFVENIPIPQSEIYNHKLSNTSIVGKLTVRNSTFKDNRSRAILVSSSDVIIENCLFERTPFPAIKFEVSNGWKESTPAKNVIIRNNTFDDTNFAPASSYPGVISFKIDKSISSSVCDVFKNIRITGNTIKNSSAPFVYAKHVQNLEVSNNTFQNTTGNGNKIQYEETQNQVLINNINAITDNLGNNCLPTTPAPSIVIDIKNLTLSTNETTRISATVSPFTANVVWSSSDTSIASVNQDGEVTGGTTSGQATITATITVNDINASKNTVNNIVYTDSCIVTNTANTLGVNEFKNNAIKIYPNPSNGLLNIHLDSKYQNATANLLDVSGRIIMSEKLKNSDNIVHLKSLSNGVYLLQIKNNGKLIDTKKIILNN